jgi:hypothetical protein
VTDRQPVSVQLTEAGKRSSGLPPDAATGNAEADFTGAALEWQ